MFNSHLIDVFGKCYKLDHSPFLVGRNREADIICRTKSISRNQFELILDKARGQWTVVNKSLIGTLINEKALHGDTVLSDGDTITAGEKTEKMVWRFNSNCNCEAKSLKREVKAKELEKDILCGELLQMNDRLKDLQAHGALEKERADELLKEKDKQMSDLLREKEKIENNLEELTRQKIEAEEKLRNVTAEAGPSTGVSAAVAVNHVEDILESELQCGVCSELFITAITLNCTHTFCRHCLRLWEKKICPICRAVISSENRSLVLDNYIEKMVENLSEDFKLRRAIIVSERLEAEADAEAVAPSRAAAKSRRRRTSARGRGRRRYHAPYSNVVTIDSP